MHIKDTFFGVVYLDHTCSNLKSVSFSAQMKSLRGYGSGLSNDNPPPCLSSAQNSPLCHRRLFSLSEIILSNFMLNLHYCGSLLGADRKRHDIAQPLFTLFLGVQQNEPVACSCRLKLRTAYQQPEYIFQYKICCEHWEKHGKICVSASHVCSRPAPKKTANPTWYDYKYKYSHLRRLPLSRVSANCVFKKLLPNPAVSMLSTPRHL